MINYINADLLLSDEKVICHQVNCKGIYGGGISGPIFKKYPTLLDKYLKHIETYKEYSFGTMNYVSEDKDVYNLYTQYNPGSCSEFEIQYMKDNYLWRTSWLVRNLEFLNSKYDRVGIPLIGSGIGADLNLKQRMSDLEYFKKYIAPYIKNLDINVYYL